MPKVAITEKFTGGKIAHLDGVITPDEAYVIEVIHKKFSTDQMTLVRE